MDHPPAADEPAGPRHETVRGLDAFQRDPTERERVRRCVKKRAGVGPLVPPRDLPAPVRFLRVDLWEPLAGRKLPRRLNGEADLPNCLCNPLVYANCVNSFRKSRTGPARADARCRQRTTTDALQREGRRLSPPRRSDPDQSSRHHVPSLESQRSATLPRPRRGPSARRRRLPGPGACARSSLRGRLGKDPHRRTDHPQDVRCNSALTSRHVAVLDDPLQPVNQRFGQSNGEKETSERCKERPKRLLPTPRGTRLRKKASPKTTMNATAPFQEAAPGSRRKAPGWTGQASESRPSVRLPISALATRSPPLLLGAKRCAGYSRRLAVPANGAKTCGAAIVRRPRRHPL